MQGQCTCTRAACGAPEVRAGESTFVQGTRSGLLTEKEARDSGLRGGKWLKAGGIPPEGKNLDKKKEVKNTQLWALQLLKFQV